jgi:regulatory protein
VFVDGHERATLSLEAIERLRLAIGTALDDRMGAALDREAAVLATYDRAINMLAARARSSVELRRLLVRKGEPAEYVAVAIERLVAAGLLDDASFARQFARSKALGAGLSRRRLQQELARKGVARELSDDAIEEVFDEEGIDDSASIERVARKKLRTLSKLDAPTQRRRLYAFLARRGFNSDDIARVVRTVLESNASTDDEVI